MNWRQSPRILLVHLLREELNLTGTHVGCDTSQCGACTVIIDGSSAKSCTVLAVQADGASVTTIEGLNADGELHPLQQAFWDEHGLQCGYCTPGMIMSGVDLLERTPDPSDDEIRRGLDGNLCRCTRLRAHHQRREDGGGRCAMTLQATPGQLVGQRVRRREDPRLVTGRGNYVDDMKLPGMLHLAFKRSDVAHGIIRSIDTSAAEAMPGVELVLSGTQLVEMIPPMPVATPFPAPDHHSVPADRVRYVGEPVAVVVATDRFLAADAADAIVVDIEELPAVVDPERAMNGDPVTIHEAFENNLAVPFAPSGTGVNAATLEVEDESALNAAFEKADVVVSQRMVSQRLVPNAMEPRGVIARFEPGNDELTVWSTTQNPHIARTLLAAILGMGQHQVRVIAPDVGGGFGSKNQRLRRRLRRGGDLAPARPAGQVDRGPLRGVHDHDPRS